MIIFDAIESRIAYIISIGALMYMREADDGE